MKALCFIKFLVIFLFGYTSLLFSQELPPISYYSPSLYKAENQNWKITQSEDKTIFIANNKGLLEYDGERWALHISPNESIIRSVTAIDDKVYTGCYMEFGFWERDSKGELVYTSLSKLLEVPMIEDEEFWNILELDQWILFQSLNRVYIYDTSAESFNILTSDERIANMFLSDDTIYFHREGKGLYKIENGKDILVSSSDIFNQDVIVCIDKNENDELLIVLQHNGIYKLQDSSLERLINFDSGKINSSIYSAITLKNGLIAVGTISNGIFLLDRTGEVKYSINQNNGINNNTILAIYEDIDGNIWLGQDNGVSCLNMNSSTLEFQDTKGELGSIYTSIVRNENLYIGTNQGLFYKKKNTTSEFKFIEGTQGQVWSLFEYDNKLFCGHNFGTFIISEDRAEKISNVQGAWTFKTIPDNPDLLLQGNYNGLYVLEKDANTWKVRNKIKGFNISSRYIEFYNNLLFVNHEYKGLFTIQLDEDYEDVVKIEIDSLKRGYNSGLMKYNNQLLYAYKEGVYKFNDSTNKFEKDSIYSLSYKDEEYLSGKLVVSEDKLWSFSNSTINYFTPGKLSAYPQITKVHFPQSIRNSVTGYESVLKLDEENYLVGSTKGYIIVNASRDIKENSDISIQKVRIKKIEDEYMKPLDLTLSTEIPYNHNNIEFLFSSFNFSKSTKVEYQYKLDGFHNQWSHWSSNSSKYFENLPHGDYTFEVRSRIGNVVSISTAKYSFTINRPWYLSNLAILGYVLIFGVLIYITNTLYKRYYQNQQRALLLQKQKEIELKEYEKKQERMKFKNESLKKEIDNKNRELAVSTMSIIKKNEFLSKLKKDLTSIEEITSIKNVVKTIDRNLNNEDDWEFFKKTFNNADKEFFKKLKKKHPSLTPNDLKLCAYLRLNLSSKEIASLLNISIRSTEVKRYRLRKKMNLPHEASLNNYIIEI